MRVFVLVLQGAFDTGLATVLDTLDTARDLAAADGSDARLEIRIVGVRRAVRTAQGMRVPVRPVPRGRPDVVIVPALGDKSPTALAGALARRDVADAGALLRRWASAGAQVCAACTGTFVLAEAGLLDGRRATTSWWLAPYFRERYPAVALDESRMVVESPPVVTAGAALAHVDLALWLIRQLSPTLAALVARYMVVDPRPSQSLYAIQDHLRHADPLVERFEQWARRNLPSPFSLDAAARSVGTSQRTLARRLQRVLGKTPLSYVQDLRVQHAVHLLHTSDASLDAIATQVGYGNGLTLRTLLRRKTGHGIRALRDRDLGAAG